MDLEKKTNKILVKGEMKEGALYIKIPNSIVEFLDLKGHEYFEARGKIKGSTGEKRKIGLKVADLEVE